MVTDKAKEQAAIRFACIILFLCLQIRDCFPSRHRVGLPESRPFQPPTSAQVSRKDQNLAKFFILSFFFSRTQRIVMCFIIMYDVDTTRKPHGNELDETRRLGYGQSL